MSEIYEEALKKFRENIRSLDIPAEGETILVTGFDAGWDGAAHAVAVEYDRLFTDRVAELYQEISEIPGGQEVLDILVQAKWAAFMSEISELAKEE